MPEDTADNIQDIISADFKKPKNMPSLELPEVASHLRIEAQVICELLPFLKQDDAYRNLLLHQHNPYCKSAVLEDYIGLAIEDGFEVSDLVFQKLEEWQKEPNSQSVITDEPVDTKRYGKVHDQSSLYLAELVPCINEGTFDSHYTSDNERERLSCNQDSTLVCNAESINKESDVKGSLCHMKQSNIYENAQVVGDEACEIVNVVKGKPCIINLDDDSAASVNSDDIVVIKEYKKHDDDIIIDDTEIESEGAAKQTGYECSITAAENVSSGHNNSVSNNNNNVADQSSRKVSDTVNETSETTNQDVKSKEPYKENDNLESDPVLWKEAKMISFLLPFLQLNNIHQSLLDNYYHPHRKYKVLEDYMELALEEGREISPNTFETLTFWQMTQRKRWSSDNAEEVKPKKSKQGREKVSSIDKPSQTEAFENDVANVVKQNLPSSSNSQEMSVNIVADDILNSLSNEGRSWYLSKADLLSEIFPSLSKDYILAQIIYCYSDSDILAVTARLLEETASALNNDIPQSYETESVSMEVQTSTEAAPSAASQEPNDTTLCKEDLASNNMFAADMEDRIQAHIHQLGEMFTDADPDFLAERANDIAGDNEEFVELVVELTENRSYPKMEEYLKRQQKMEMRKKFIEGMIVEEFLEYFEDPEKVFCDTSKEMSKLYVTNAKSQLMKDLPYHLSKVIDTVLRSNNYHYLPTLRFLRKDKGLRKTKRTVGGKQPGDLDDIFLKELCYAKMEKKIKEYHKQKEEMKKLAFEQAKVAGDLQECQCCFDDEILVDNMSPCSNEDNPHLFCNNCIKRYSEEQIGQGKQDFICLQGECKSPFSLNTLKKLLKPSIFSNLLKRKQAEEIAAAGIEDLESCPFCNFATIMPNKEDKVFKCLNPECFKDSCRLCKEPNHIPLRCEEVEKKKQTEARTYLENEMSEAVVRECYKCKRRFIKEEGCNKMICSCGAMMCYLCKKPIRGYDHFASDSRVNSESNHGKCPLWSNSLKLHAEEVQQRAAEAKQKIDPSVELIHDPTKDLPQVPDYLKKPPNPPADLAHGRNRMEPEMPRDPLVLDFLLENVRHIQRHSHQHRHTHIYLPMPDLPRPPPAHLPPPPPAHRLQPHAPIVARIHPNMSPNIARPFHRRLDQSHPSFCQRLNHRPPPPFHQRLDEGPLPFHQHRIDQRPPTFLHQKVDKIPQPFHHQIADQGALPFHQQRIDQGPLSFHPRMDQPVPVFHHQRPQQHIAAANYMNAIHHAVPWLNHPPAINQPQQPLPAHQQPLYSYRPRNRLNYPNPNHHPPYPPNNQQHGNHNQHYQYGN